MPEPKVFEFSKHIGALCVKRDTNVYKLGLKLGVDPQELLRMVNGKIAPTKAVIAGLAKELDSDVRYLEKLAAEIQPHSDVAGDQGAKKLTPTGPSQGQSVYVPFFNRWP